MHMHMHNVDRSYAFNEPKDKLVTLKYSFLFMAIGAGIAHAVLVFTTLLNDHHDHASHIARGAIYYDGVRDGIFAVDLH